MTPVMVIVDSNTERTVDLIHGNLYILFDKKKHVTWPKSTQSHLIFSFIELCFCEREERDNYFMKKCERKMNPKKK